MPCPISPQPTTPTLEISISLCFLRPLPLRASGDYMGLVETFDRDGVRHVVMQRAEKRNAMNDELVAALGEAFEQAAADDEVRCIVVRGDGPMFSSGMDLAALRALAERPETLRP